VPFILILIGAVLLIAALRNTQGDLATAIETDAPGFFKWALAIMAVGALGWVPGMRTISRWLLALVLVVLVLRNYSKLFAGFKSLSQTTPVASNAPTTPAQAYVANPNAPNITTAQITGTSGNINAAAQPTTTKSPLGQFDPSSYLASVESGFGGIA
jgi:hypothetical protein